MIKKLAASIREYKIKTVLTPILMIGEVTCECIIPMITAKLINSIEAGCSMQDIAKYGLLLVLMAVISLMFGALAGITCATASAGFAKNLRKDLFYRIQGFSFSNIDRFSTASLVTRMTTDVTNVQMSFMMIIRVAVRAPLMLIFATVMGAVVGKKLALIFCCIIPLLACGLGFVIYKALPLFRAAFKRYDNLNNSIQENIKGMRVVKSFVREEYEKEKFTKASGDVAEMFTKAEKFVAFNNPFMQTAVYTSMILLSVFTSYFVVSTGGTYLEVGTLASMLTYSMQILMSLMMLSMIFVMITISVESAKRIVEVLDENSDITQVENPVTTVKDGSIEFENVSFKYSKNAEVFALEGINLSIKPGETVGIIGGTDVREYDLNVLRDQVSVVLQKNVLFSGTIKENLRWGDPNASDEELVRICKLAQADEFVSAFPDGYDTYIEQGGSNVSGGQKQRLCIARALLKKPKILILDDSTSAVDTKTDALLRAAFRSEIPGTTKIIIAQRISSVQDADKIVVMENGRIDGVGTHEELLKNNSIYSEVYYSQVKGGEDDE